MSEHQRQTAFLRDLILYDETNECLELEQKIAGVQRDKHCLQCWAWLMGVLTAVAVACLGYGVVLQENFPYNSFQFANKVIFEIGLASLVCLMVFAGLLAVYRERLNRLREECRKLVTRILKARLGHSPIANLRGHLLELGDRQVVQSAKEVSESLA